MEPSQPCLISVYLRFRPLTPQEKQVNEAEIWKNEENSVSIPQEIHSLITEQRKSQLSKSFTFSNPYLGHVFMPETHNPEIFSSVCGPFVDSALQGYNFTLFAFGQTGSGKTYTMLGSENIEYLKHKRRRSASPCRNLLNKVQISNKGLSLLFFQDLFQKLQTNEKDYRLLCSYFEIYNENVYDLLGTDESLVVSEDPLKGFFIKNLNERPVSSFEQAFDLICTAESNRKFSPTEQNQHSSRSHVILKLCVIVNEGSYTFESQVHFVDLAGSERLSSKKFLNAESINEGKHINTSLFYLCSVIHKLSEKNNSGGHIPYRNSNLTKILRNAIGGNSYTSIICTASPGLSCYDMTLSTIAFAEAAKKVTNKVSQNYKGNSPSDIIKTLQSEILILKSAIKAQGRLELVDKWVETENFENQNKEIFALIEEKGKDFDRICGLEREKKELFEDLQEKNRRILVVGEEWRREREENRKFARNLRKSEENIARLEELVKELRRENDLVEGKFLGKMKYEAICDLEKFYMKGIDRAKDFKARHFKDKEEYLRIQTKSRLLKVLSPVLCDKENLINIL